MQYCALQVQIELSTAIECKIVEDSDTKLEEIVFIGEESDQSYINSSITTGAKNVALRRHEHTCLLCSSSYYLFIGFRLSLVINIQRTLPLTVLKFVQ